ncbi:phage capsid family protein [Variibacter gotjawalensis]|uniref:Phage capsid family protein n=1 Tax=Variibacter gotjawalensis TaxID=1333996 RepID=A0A0S3PZ93_9BRAD|nr:HK97 family phage major capsid protein [Variibacter gotjawalensis]BAT61234.1 phage capsid family protein [Variibacter gotjawalensis]
MDSETNFETKAAYSADAMQMHGDLMRMFETFKATNDERLDVLERRGGDVVAEDKVARIDAAIERQARLIDDLIVKSGRPALDGAARPTRWAEREHKAAFDDYIRRGEVGALRALEQKAMSIGSNPDGGYLVPPQIETDIGRRLAAISPIRAIASVREVSSSVYTRPFLTTGPAVGWVGESAPRPQTNSPTLDALAFPTAELYAMPAATAALLDDAAVNIDEWLAGEIDTAFAEQEGAAFVKGDGAGKPKGFVSYPTVANTAWTWGNIGTLSTGVAGAFAASNPSDSLIDLIYALRPGYRQNAVFVMNRKTQSVIRKFKDASGAYLW